MKNNKKALIFLLIALLSFSSYEVVSKTVIGYIDPSQLTFIRFLVGGIFLMPFAIKDLKSKKIKLGKNDILWMGLLGILNVTVSMNLIQIGYRYTNANLSAIIISSNPIIVAVISSFVLRETLTYKKVLGLVLGIIGVLVALGGTGDLGDAQVIYGIGLQVAGMLAFSLFTVLGKKSSLKFGSSTMTAVTDLIGALGILPFVLAKGIQPFSFQLSEIWIQMIYICIINTGIAFYLYFKALEQLDTSLGSMSFFVKPLLASVIAAIFLSESLTVQIFIGIILVAVGIRMVMKSSKTRGRVKRPKVSEKLESIGS